MSKKHEKAVAIQKEVTVITDADIESYMATLGCSRGQAIVELTRRKQMAANHITDRVVDSRNQRSRLHVTRRKK